MPFKKFLLSVSLGLFSGGCWILQVIFQALASVLGANLEKKIRHLIIQGIYLPLIPLFTIRFYKLLSETLWFRQRPVLLLGLGRGSHKATCSGRMESGSPNVLLQIFQPFYFGHLYLYYESYLKVLVYSFFLVYFTVSLGFIFSTSLTE